MNIHHISRTFRRAQKRSVRMVTRRYSRTRRAMVRTMRRKQRQFQSWRSRQYFVSGALHDLHAAIQRNEDVFVGCAIASVLLVYAFAAAASQLLFFSFQSLNALSDMTGLGMGGLTLVGLGATATIAAWFLVLITNALDLAVLDGAFRRTSSSIRRTMRHALSLTTRVSMAWFLTLASIGAGMLLVNLPFLLYLLSHRHQTLPLGIATLAVLVCLIALYAFSSILLAPLIALYEPKLSLHTTFVRSIRLVQARGRGFVSGLFLLLIAAIGGSWEASVWLQHALHYNGDIVFYLLGMLELVSANLLLTMLYRKRRIARPVAKRAARLDWHRFVPTAPLRS
ncbi:MAG TPA: hypothetical protein VFN56_05010 [Candidatus Saccharimonadales bacterium]|nr:hypothetical protein [Candidatus Saccharimonadales bacterium]